MPRPSAASDTPSLEGTERILLVEDEEMVRLVARAVLGYRGYQIVEAVDGEEAVRKFSEAREPFDLVLMDVHMPRLNGWDALAQIRGRRPDATVIMLSGGPTEEFSGKIHELGAAAVMHKPFDNIELLRLVRRTLDAARKKA